MDTRFDMDKLALYSGLVSDFYECPARFEIIKEAAANEADANNVRLNGNWQALELNVQFLQKAGSDICFRLPIRPGAEEILYWLVLDVEARKEFDEKQIKNLVLFMVKTADLVCSDFIQTETLSGMAHELAIRYEELNMFYDLDASSDKKAEESDHEKTSLTELAESCLDYLHVDLVAIFVPSEKLCLVRHFEECIPDSMESLLNYLNGEAYNEITTSGETWVINHHEVTDWITDLQHPYKLIISPIKSSDKSVIGIMVMANDIEKPDFTNSDRKLAHVIATEVSKILVRKRDVLTGLLNRHGYELELKKTIDKYADSDKVYSLIQINIDQFRIINETIGYDGGDHVLCQVAKILKLKADRLRQKLKDKIIVARTGVDEFSVLIEQDTSRLSEKIASKIKRSFKDVRYSHGDNVFGIKLSIGVVHIDDDMRDISSIMKILEVTCSAAKEMGGDRVRIYKSTDEEFVQHDNMIRGARLVKEALSNNSLVLYGQEIVSTNNSDSRQTHYEVLIRIMDNGKPVSPGLFIPAAEKYKLMTSIDKWVLKHSFEYLQKLGNEGRDNIILSINISGQSIGDERFIEYVESMIETYNISTSQVCLEITETAAVQNMHQALKFIHRMRELGCSFALDDFGSGMSSFYYLKNMPVDYLKIDGGFVKSMLNNAIDHAMVESINNIGHVLGLKTVAEFVENNDISKALAAMGVDYLQGYELHKPEPLRHILNIHQHLPILQTANG